jgi:hypothetical protein
MLERAVEAYRIADRDLAVAITACRLAGYAWDWIGGMMGCSAQMARQRFQGERVALRQRKTPRWP